MLTFVSMTSARFHYVRVHLILTFVRMTRGRGRL